MDNRPEDYVHCPFYPEHWYPKTSAWKHIMKCKRNWLRDPKVTNRGDMSICNFDPLHIIPIEQYETHCNECPTRVLLELAMGQDVESGTGSGTVPIQDTHVPLIHGDNWDDVDAPPTLRQVQREVLAKDVFILQQNASKSELERKRIEERERRRRIQERANGCNRPASRLRSLMDSVHLVVKSDTLNPSNVTQ